MAGEEDGVGAEEALDHSQLLTDPEEAADFVKKTKVDALAIAIGTSHGAYKFTKPPTGDTLSIQRIKEIHARIPDTHLVMRLFLGSRRTGWRSSTEYGGEIKETYGVPVEEIVEGIKYGVRKGEHRQPTCAWPPPVPSAASWRRTRARFDPRKYFSKTVEAMRDICIARYEAFGTAGSASKDQADLPGRHVPALRSRRAGSEVN
ncbi:class II fructose-bisphosphate aldolase [Pseudomonas aeruginosa]